MVFGLLALTAIIGWFLVTTGLTGKRRQTTIANLHRLSILALVYMSDDASGGDIPSPSYLREVADRDNVDTRFWGSPQPVAYVRDLDGLADPATWRRFQLLNSNPTMLSADLAPLSAVVRKRTSDEGSPLGETEEFAPLNSVRIDLDGSLHICQQSRAEQSLNGTELALLSRLPATLENN